MRTAAPVIDDLDSQLAGHPLCLLLADGDCRVVKSWSGDRSLQTKLETRGVAAGANLEEGAVGTNALGTAFETRHGVAVNGAEHFLCALRDFSCYGHPIRHPLTRRIEGVLNITNAGPESNPLFAPLLQRAVRDIEGRLLDSARVVDQRLFHAFQNATRRRSVPVAVLGGDVVLANRSCFDRLGSSDPTVLRNLLPEPLRAARGTTTLDFGPEGRLQVEIEPIDGTPDGALFYINDHPEEGANKRDLVSRPGPAVGPPGVLLPGEPGTGRTTEARRLAGSDPVIVLEATDALVGSERDWATRFQNLASNHDGVLLVEEIQVLSERLCAIVRRAFGSPTTTARIVLTSCPLEDMSVPVAGLAGRCGRRTELLPLRERTNELPALIAEMGQARRPDRAWTLTSRALETVAAHPWPGNLAELADLIAELCTRPIAGRIDVDDLPARYRCQPRVASLGGRERAERTAMITALRGAGGNKRNAAAHLGISRTTLYRRMRALGIAESDAKPD